MKKANFLDEKYSYLDKIEVNQKKNATIKDEFNYISSEKFNNSEVTLYNNVARELNIVDTECTTKQDVYKTKLVLSVNPNTFKQVLKCYDTKTTFDYNSEENKFHSTTKKELVNVSNINNSKIAIKSIGTDLFSSYVMHIAPKMVYTDLNTVYTKTSDLTCLFLMYECLNVMHNGLNSKSDFTEYVENKSNVKSFMIKKLHEYDYIIIGNKRYKKEIVPYETLELTELAKELFKDKEIINNSDIQDLLSEVYIACYELFSFGLLTCTFDLWNYRNYIYKKVNAYIRKQRTFKTKNSESYENMLLLFDEETLENKLYYGKNANNLLASVESKEVKNTCLKLLYNSLDKRCNKTNIVTSFELYYLQEKTLEEIASILNVSTFAIHKYLVVAEKTLKSNAQVKEALHELLA